MKLLIYSAYSPLITDGISSTTRDLVLALENKGTDVTVCTTSNGWTKQEIGKQQFERLRIFKSLPSRKADFSPGLFLYLKKNMRKFDLVQFSGTFNLPTIIGSYIAQKENIPYIICPAGNMIPSVSKWKIVRNALWKNIFFNLWAKKALNNANRIICASMGEKQDTQGHIFNKDIICINYGINHLIYKKNINREIIEEKLGIPNKKKFLFFLGRLSYEKRIPFLLDVWEEASKKMPEMLLVIGGGGSKNYRTRLMRQIRHIKRRENIFMTGEVRGDLKLALLQHCQCLLLPSYFESFGVVVLESLVSGRPVIASQGTPWGVLEEKNFGRWLAFDKQSWVDAIRKMFIDGTYQGDEFLKRSRKWVIENYDWKDVAQRYLDVYEEILRRN